MLSAEALDCRSVERQESCRDCCQIDRQGSERRAWKRAEFELIESTLDSGSRRYSASVSPEPPSSAGKSLSLGRPSLIGSTVDS